MRHRLVAAALPDCSALQPDIGLNSTPVASDGRLGMVQNMR
jgi:hypothetical protein